MESSQPENGLVIERLTMTKAHDVSEIDSKVCYNGATNDATEATEAPHSLPDPENFHFKVNSFSQPSKFDPDNGGDTGILENGIENGININCLKNCGEIYQSSFTELEVGSGGCESKMNVVENGPKVKDQICIITGKEYGANILPVDVSSNVKELKVGGEDNQEECMAASSTDNSEKSFECDKNDDSCRGDNKGCKTTGTSDNRSEDGQQKQDQRHLNKHSLDIPPQIFEDITEDEDSEDEESFENIELELDDLLDPTELSRSSESDEKGKSESAVAELIKPAGQGNESTSLPDSDTGNGQTGPLENSDSNSMSKIVSNSNLMSDKNKAAGCLEQPKSSSSMILELDEHQKDKQEQLYTILSLTNTFNAAPSSTEGTGKNIKQKVTARKSGKPINQNDSSTLKTVNLHPIKNIIMKLSDIKEALDYDPLRDCGSSKRKSSESLDSCLDNDSNSALNSTEVISEKNLTHMKKKKRKNTYDFPGCKKKPRRVRSDEQESMGLSADSASLSDEDFEGADPSSHINDIADPLEESSVDSLTTGLPVFFAKKPKPSSELSSTAASSSSVTSSSSPPSVKSSKMKSVLDMLHARSKQKAELEKTANTNMVQTVSVTTGENSTTTTILVSPPPNKPIIEGVKRKGTPRKRKGKRRRDSSDNCILLAPSVPISAPQLQPNKQRLTSTFSQAPVVMVVTQHSSVPGLRSLLPRHAYASSTSSGSIVQPSSGSMMGSMPLVSALPVGVKALNLANLPPGVAAVPISSLSPGSQSAMTFFTAGTGTAISGANLSITSPKQFINSGSPSSNIRTTSSATSVTTSLASSNSDSLRALLVGKPNTYNRVTAGTSPQLSPTPVLFQMVTPSGTGLVPVPPQPVTLNTSATLSMLKSSSTISMGKSSYSLLKPHSSAALNGIACLTPPKTPDADSSSEFAVAASLGRPASGQVEDSEIIPLCCCKISGASFNKLSSGVIYCQALDTVDNKVLGCCNKVTNPQLVRPGVKIPFMAVCEVHRKRLKLHQCCPGCGQFCTQGKFQQCCKDGTSSVHHFHKPCVFYRGGKYFCPHCGEETSQCEVELKVNEKPEEIKTVPPRPNRREAEKKTARIGLRNYVKSRSTSEPKVKTLVLPNNKIIKADFLLVGPDLQILTKLCGCALEDRPKKYRNLTKDLYTPACEADLEKVFYLLVDGMDASMRYDVHEDQTAMHAAAISGSVGVIFLLHQFGAEVHAQDKNLRTPMMCAAENGNLKAVQFLTRAGARVEDRGEDGMTSLHYAAKTGHVDIVRHILETGKLDVNTQDDGGWTPIMWATELQLPEVVKYLLSQGGDPSMKDNEENTGLHWAAFSGSLTIAEMFLDRGCEIDAINEHGDRPLHIAARQDHYDMIVLLLARGADVNTKNNKDESPVESCTNKTGQVWMTLKVNQQLRSFAAWKIIRSERLLDRDITMGREKNPIACVNSEDDEPCPMDYLYVSENVETSPLNLNYVITSLQSCRCKDECSSLYCVCGRSSVKCWYDKVGRLLDEVNLLEPPLVFECNRACRCWVNCNNRVVQNGITCRLQMFRTNGRGWGVRALMDIPKGTFVCEYIGELISDSEADRREDDSYLFDLDNKDGDTYCIDARKYGNISRFINHLCEPNLVPVKVFVEHQDLRFPRICLFSSRDINAYEELGFDYGEKFWMIKWKHFTCACKSEKCKYSSETIKKTLADYKLRYPDENVDL